MDKPAATGPASAEESKAVSPLRSATALHTFAAQAGVRTARESQQNHLAPVTLADSVYERQLAELSKQRDKAIAEATEPINRLYRTSLELLLKKATQAVYSTFAANEAVVDCRRNPEWIRKHLE